MGISGAKIGAAGARGGMTLMDAWRLENRVEQVAAAARSGKDTRNALLSGTALGVAVFAGVALSSTGASAACTISPGNSPLITSNSIISPQYRGQCGDAATVQADGSVEGSGLSVTGFGTATVNNSGTVASSNSSNRNALDIQALNASYIGSGTVTGGNSGIVLSGNSLSVTGVAATQGNQIKGNNGDGIKGSAAVGAATLDLNGFAISGSKNGVDLSAITTVDATFTNSSVTGSNGDGLKGSSAWTEVTATGTTFQGSKNGISSQSVVTILDLTGGSVTGTTNDGIHSDNGQTDVSTSITTTNTNVTGGQNGINTRSGTNTLDLTGGHIKGLNGDGIVANGLYNNITTDGTDVTGSGSGINVTGISGVSYNPTFSK